MQIIRLAGPLPPSAQGAAVALGNFDGVHRGHQAVLAAARQAAVAAGVPLGVLTFEPHPRALFRPADPPFRLTPLRAKVLQLQRLGVDLLYLARFDRAFSQIAAEAFVTDVLVRRLGVRHVVVGEDFVFGHKRGGDVALLRRMAARLGFGAMVVPPAGDGAPFKSSHVRALLADGRPLEAAGILGHWWQVAGRVEHGAGRGRRFGYPTANVALGPLLRPCFGVYAARVGIERELGGERPAVVSIGIRPMFRTDLPLLEAHLFDFVGDLYGRHLCVDVLEFLRPEATFADIAALRRQMDQDAAQARAILADPTYAPGRFRTVTA